MRRAIVFLGCALVVGLMPAGTAGADPEGRFTLGASGVGDPYFPMDGNGGYDVQHCGLRLRFDPVSDRLEGVATIAAAATQNLSSFNLDLDGLRVAAVTVDGARANWSHARGELTVRPRSGIPDGARFVTVIRYQGVPQGLVDVLGTSGFMHTADGAVVIGQPHVAST